MTLEKFYAEVLKKLGVIAAEEAPVAADRLEVENKYIQVHAELSRREIIPWFDDEEVPDWASDAMSAVIADRLCSTFSVPQEKEIKIRVEAQEGLTTIIGDGQRRPPPERSSEFY